MKKYDSDFLKGIDYEIVVNNKKIEYINIECGFDIETTSTYIDDDVKTSFMYIWTFGIKNSDFLCYGRTWDEFKKLCLDLKDYFKLSENRILTCYIHNLSYEFQFMRKYFNWLNVFSVDERKPIKALCDYGIEFKDSYILSGFSLDRLAKNLMNHKINKLQGNLDYTLIRHSETVLTDAEIKYCENDVIIILYYINEQIELYGDILKIPLTNTGRVRKYVKEQCYQTNNNHKKSSKGKFKRYRKIMNDLQIEEKEYHLLKQAFMGGFTHANANYTNQIIDNVTSIDFTSSYPAVMLSEKFPMGKGVKTKFTSDRGFKFYRDNYCLVFVVRFKNITSSLIYENYISESKCLKLSKPIINNGRVFSADELVMVMTDVDLDIIENSYTWDTMEVSNVVRYSKGYLPKDIIKSVISLYADKTTLKGVAGKEVEYMISKGMLNSTYGMCVTDIVRDMILYDDDWGFEKANFDEQLEKYNKSYNRFLFYPWGVWITAYARRNLWSGIYAMGDDYIYSDTDSIKFRNYDKHKKYINNYNNLIINKLKKMCEHYSLNFDDLQPKTIEGIEKPIGVWDNDGNYKRFKTLGAKRYLVEFENGDMELTVAGLSKRNGLDYMRENRSNDDTFNLFNDDLYIPAEKTGKMTHTYIDELKEFNIVDYNNCESYISVKSGVHLEKCDFTLSVTRQYISFIENLKKGYLYKGLKTI